MPTSSQKTKVDEAGFPTRSFPTTRYQGSKRKMLRWIWERLRDVQFDSALDLFGGTGVVGYLFKAVGKSVTHNDYLRFNYLVGLAIIENAHVRLTAEEIDYLVRDSFPASKPYFIQETFQGIYYTDEENGWLDRTIAQIVGLDRWNKGQTLRYKRALAYYALFQACLIKRPFNLFHRKNLYLRTADVPRSFGNKTSWERPFSTLFERFLREVNELVFDNGKRNRAMNADAYTLDQKDYDLVYIDPPYICARRSPSQSNYRRLYHFLEGIARYPEWGELIDYDSYNLRLKDDSTVPRTRTEMVELMDSLFERFAESIIVVSYKSPGVPTRRHLVRLLKKYKDRVVVHRLKYNYALNRRNGQPRENIELLLIAQ